MSSSNRLPPAVDARSAELLERAYALDSDEETHRLYRDWADTYDKTMLDGLGYLSPRLVSELLATGISDLNGRVLDVGAGTGLAGTGIGHGNRNIPHRVAVGTVGVNT